MFIQLTQKNYQDLKVRIAVDKIIFYMQNPEDATGSVLAAVDGGPVEILETVEQIDKMISLKIYGSGESTGPKEDHEIVFCNRHRSIFW
jgi:hypothetical protein